MINLHGNVFKTHPLRGLPPPRPRYPSPPTPLSSTILSFLQLLLIFKKSLTILLGSTAQPSTLLLGGGGATPLTSQSSSFVTLVPRSRGTSTPVNADVDDPLSPSQKLPDGHLPLPLQPLSHPCYSPTPLTGLIMIFVPCLNSFLVGGGQAQTHSLLPQKL